MKLFKKRISYFKEVKIIWQFCVTPVLIKSFKEFNYNLVDCHSCGSGYSCSTGLIPGLGISACHGHGQKNLNKQNLLTGYNSTCGNCKLKVSVNHE